MSITDLVDDNYSTINSESSASYQYGTWDLEYAKPGLTDWEQLPANDMRDVVAQIGPDLSSLRSGLEIGCGRGLRSLVMLRTLDALNRESFALHAIDQSPLAIRTARALFAASQKSDPLKPPFDAALSPFLGHVPAPSRATATHENADLFEFLARPDEAFDLVIDWMCFHEIAPEAHKAYAALVAARCRRYFVINMFSTEGSSLADLGLVAGVQKYQASEAQVRALFEPHFDVVASHQFPENLNPIPAPSDGIVAAKRAYILRRRAQAER